MHINLQGVAIGNGVIDEATQVRIIYHEMVFWLRGGFQNRERETERETETETERETERETETESLSFETWNVTTFNLTIAYNFQEASYPEYAYTHGLISVEGKNYAEQQHERCAYKVTSK